MFRKIKAGITDIFSYVSEILSAKKKQQGGSAVNNMNFVKGLGAGMLLGCALGMTVAPKKGSSGKLGKMLKTVSKTMDGMICALGL